MRNDNKTDIILSIGILVAGRKEEVWKCLDSLKHLRDAIACELIIADTGCDKNIRKKLEEYADVMLDFKWCDDFAAARNATVDAAGGKWFLYLDDDEWFESTASIEKFFKTGEYGKFSNAMYVQRNYTDIGGNTFEDAWVKRMFSLEEGVRFKGRIHEYIDPDDGRCATILDHVHHFGYVFTDSVLEKAHLERNMSLLKLVFEEEPDNIRWGVHLEQEYYVAGDYRAMIETADTCLERFKNREDAVAIGTFHAAKIIANISLGDANAAFVAAVNGINDELSTQVTRAYCAYFASELALKYGDYEALIDCIPVYWENYDWLEVHETDRAMQSTTNFTKNYAGGRRFFNAAVFAVCAGIALATASDPSSENGAKDIKNGYEMIKKYSVIMETSDIRTYLPDGAISVLVVGMKSLADADARRAVFEKLFQNERLRGNMYDEAIRQEGRYGYLLELLDDAGVDDLFVKRAHALEILADGTSTDSVSGDLKSFSALCIDYYKEKNDIKGDIPQGTALPRDVAAAMLIGSILDAAKERKDVNDIFPMVKQTVEIYPVLAQSMKQWVSEYIEFKDTDNE